jgi:cell division protease FtsH
VQLIRFIKYLSNRKPLSIVTPSMLRVRLLSFGAALCALVASSSTSAYASSAHELAPSVHIVAGPVVPHDQTVSVSPDLPLSADTSSIFTDDDVAPGAAAAVDAAGNSSRSTTSKASVPAAAASSPTAQSSTDGAPTGAGSPYALGVLKEMRSSPEKWTSHESDLGTLYRDLNSGEAIVAGVERFDDVREVFVQTKNGYRYYAVATTSDKVETWLNDWAKKGGTYANITPDNSDYTFVRFGLILAVFVAGYFVMRKFVMPAANPASTTSNDGTTFAVSPIAKKAPTSARGYEVIRSTGTRFSDVIGTHEAKEALSDLLDCLRGPEHFRRLNAKAPRGVLLSGPPGTGKTLLARALAGEANCSFIATSGSDFTNKYIGESSKNVRALFQLARQNAPCIIFIDEMDGLGKRSTDDSGGAQMEHNKTINSILTEMDGFGSAEGVIVLAATNHPELLDNALLREGRFDRKVTVKLPTVNDREALFKHYAKKTIVKDDVDLGALARRSTGMSPSAIASAMNLAATMAAKKRAESVNDEDLRAALEQQIMGAPDKHYVSTEDERNRVAYHEAGHAVIAKLLSLGVVDKVTIIPHGNARGLTLVTNEQEDNMQTRTKLFNYMVMLMGGRAAELLQFNEHGSGVSDDLGRCSAIAYDMVSKYGFGEETGAFSIAYLPKGVIGEVNNHMMSEARKLVQDAANEARRLLTKHRPVLTRLAEELLRKEFVEVEELEELLAA